MGETGPSKRPRPDLDPVDVGLLRLLRYDARLSSRRLGREIGMSPGAVSERVARLERDGVIRGYRADVDPRALGFGMRVIVGLRTEQSPLLQQTLDEVASIPEVERVDVVAGSWDLVLYIHARDHDHLRSVILDLKQAILVAVSLSHRSARAGRDMGAFW